MELDKTLQPQLGLFVQHVVKEAVQVPHAFAVCDAPLPGAHRLQMPLQALSALQQLLKVVTQMYV